MLKFLGKAFLTPRYHNEDMQRSAHFLNVISSVVIFVLIGMFISRVMRSSWVLETEDLVILGALGSLAISQIIMRIGYVNDSSFLFIATAWAVMTYQAYSTAGIRDISIIAYVVIILVASLLLGLRTAIITTVFSIAVIWILAILERNGKLIPNLDTPTNLARDVTILFILLTVIIYLFADNLRSSLQEVRNRGLELSTINNKLENLPTGSEQRTSDQTKAVERKAGQLQAITAVGSATTALFDLKQLISQLAFHISEKFGYYHVGIFLLDERNEYLVLQGSNSPGGGRMLDQGYKFKVGQEGIVGLVAGTQAARISMNVDEDVHFFNNPDLPDTQSEIALPLAVGGTILGVLDIQSKESNAFVEDDIITFQLLADQIAVSIQNVLFLQQTRDARQETRSAHEESSRLGWKRFFGGEREAGFLSIGDKTEEISRKLDPGLGRVLSTGKIEVWPDGNTIGVPVQSGNRTIGAIRLQKPIGLDTWSEAEILDAKNLANQLSLALENARLLKEAQRRAAREQAIDEISAAISSFSDVDSILRTTVQELGNKIANTEVIFELGTEKVGE